VEGYVGRLFGEGGFADPLSGLSPQSFWMTLPCLIETLGGLGFVVENEHIVPNWNEQGPRVHLAAVKS
jgi:hypothetical protein